MKIRAKGRYMRLRAKGIEHRHRRWPPSRRDRSERDTPATIRARNQHREQRRQEQREDEEDQREEQAEDEEDHREEQAEDEEQQLYTLYGITVDENNVPSMDKETFKTVIEHIKSRYKCIRCIDDSHTYLYICINKGKDPAITHFGATF